MPDKLSLLSKKKLIEMLFSKGERSKFSHLLMVRLATVPPPPVTVSLTIKYPGFFLRLPLVLSDNYIWVVKTTNTFIPPDIWDLGDDHFNH